MSPRILSCIGRNWRTSAFVLWMIVAGPMCGGGGGGGGGGAAPPTFNVVLRFPANGATNVARTQTIYLTVNGAVNPATLAGNITVTGTAPITITTNWNPVLSQIEIIPQGAGFLQSNTTHLVSVTSGVQTMGGASMVPTMFSFTTVTNPTDVTLPTFGGATGAVVAGGAAAVDTITLSWAAGTDPGGTAQASLIYDVYLATATGQVNYATNPVASSAAGALSVNVTPLGSNTQYFFVVRCRDGFGNRDANTTERTAKTNVRFSTDIYNAIINNSATGHCTNCHTPGGQSAFMDLSISASDTVVNKFVNIPADAGTGPSPLPSCGGAGRIRVIPNDAANSLLLQKVAAPGPPPCGVRMPEDGATNGFLTGVQIQTISDWITQGAPNN